MEQVDVLPRRISIGEPELCAIGLEHVGAIELRVADPAGEDLRMFRDQGAVVILSFVVDGHLVLPALIIRDCCKVALRARLDSQLESARACSRKVGAGFRKRSWSIK